MACPISYGGHNNNYSLLPAAFRAGLSPCMGDTLHRWGLKLARRRGPCQIPLHCCDDQDIAGPLKLRFDQNVEYKRPQGRRPIPCAIFITFAEFVPRFMMR